MKTSVVCQIRMPSLFHSRSVFALEGEYLLIGDNDLLPIGYPVVTKTPTADLSLPDKRLLDRLSTEPHASYSGLLPSCGILIYFHTSMGQYYTKSLCHWHPDPLPVAWRLPLNDHQINRFSTLMSRNPFLALYSNCYAALIWGRQSLLAVSILLAGGSRMPRPIGRNRLPQGLISMPQKT